MDRCALHKIDLKGFDGKLLMSPMFIPDCKIYLFPIDLFLEGMFLQFIDI